MFHAIRLHFARKAYTRALADRIAYDRTPSGQWDITLAIAYSAAECRAANRLARLIDPRAIVRAF
jgi:hypothetical protein